MAGEVLREFLVSLGWKVEAGQQQQFMNAVRTATLQATLLADALEGISKKAVNALRQIGDEFEALYYASQRTGTTVQNLKAIQFAAGQLGSTADAARASIESLGRHLMESPGYASLLNTLGVETKNGRLTENSITQLGAALRKFRDEGKLSTAVGYGRALGLDDNFMIAIMDGKFEQELNKVAEKAKALGIDWKKLAEDSKNFNNGIRELGLSLGLIKDQAVSSFMERFGADFQGFIKYLDAHGKDIADALADIGAAILDIAEDIAKFLPKLDAFIKEHGGWKLAIEGTVGALVLLNTGLATLALRLTTLAAVSMPVWLLRLLGLGGVAAGAVAGSLAYGESSGNAGIREEFEAARRGDTRNWWQRTMPKMLGGKDAPNLSGKYDGGGGNEREVTAFIRAEAVKRGIDPDVAVAVARSEGLKGYTTEGRDPGGDQGTSFGPFQLHYKNSIPGLSNGGLGDAFTKRTGLDARDRSTWRQQVQFALDEAAKGGWGPWHGAANTGISSNRGLAGAHPVGVDMSLGLKAPSASAPQANPFGGFDVRSLQNAIQRSNPVGQINQQPTVGPQSWNTSTTHVNAPQTVSIHVEGSGNPGEVGQYIAGQQSRVNGDLVRNLQGAIA